MAARKTSTDSERDRRRASNGKRHRRRKKRMGGFFYLLLVLFVLCAGVLVVANVFFKVEVVDVTGLTKYTAQEVIEASGIQAGDSLVKLKSEEIEDKLTDAYTYIEEVKLHKKYPSTVVLEIVQAKPVGAVEAYDGYILLSSRGTELERGVQEVPADVPVVKGLYVSDSQSEEAKKELNQKSATLAALQKAMEEEGFSNLTDFNYIDITDRLNIVLVYQSRLRVELGSESQLNYKLKFLKKAIDETWGPEELLLVDASTPGEISYRPATLEDMELPQTAQTEDVSDNGSQEEEGNESSSDSENTQGEQGGDSQSGTDSPDDTSSG